MTVAKLMQNGELRVKGVDTRSPLVTDGLVAHYPMDGTTHSTNTHFVAKAQNYPYETEDGIWDEYENTWLFNSGRSWHISVWDMYTNDWAVGINFQGASAITGPHARYDIYAVPAQITSFVNTINTLNSSNGRYMVAITGGHAAETNFSSSTTMKDAIKLCGGTTGKLSWSDRRTYICVGEVGCGEGNAQEEELGSTGNVTLRVPFFFYAKASTNTNNTITNEYVAIEEGTTNIITNTNLDTGWAKSYCKDILWNDTHPPLGIDAQVVSFKDSDGNGSGYWYCYGDYAPQNPSTTYTISIYARTVGNSVAIYAYTADNSEVGRQSTNTLTVPGNGEWVRLVFNSITTPSNTQSDSLSFNISSFPPNQRLWLCAPQMEAKPFATEYVDGSRSGDGNLKYTVTLANNATISFDYFCKERISNTVISNSQYNYWWGLYLNSSGYLYTHEGHDGSAHTSSYLMPLNTWVNITIKWDNSIQYYYADGVLVGSIATVGSANSANIPIISLGYGWNIGNALFKNLSIYNRALSDDEVKKLAKGTHKFTTNGLITKSINQKPIVPDTANYFPFDFDGKDYLKSISPVKDENTEYVDGSVWIGSGTTNLYNSCSKSFTRYSSSTQYPIAPPDKFVNGGGWTSLSWSGDIVLPGTYAVGSKVTFSGWYMAYTTDTSISTTSPRTNGLHTYDNSGGLGIAIDSCKWNTWTYFEKTVTVNGGSSVRIEDRGYDYQNDNAGLTSAYWFNIQITTDNISTPFTESTRGESSLHLPYNIIDCKQDFTIYGWWYPKVYADGVYRPCLTRNIPDSNSTYNRILIMGNGTTSRQLRSWDSSNGTTEGATLVPTTTLVRDNEWNFFCYRRSGANIILSLGNSTGISHGISANAAHLNSDETGQVWQVGEYANSESDAYHRDYVFYQGAMTDAEIERVFKTKMSAKVSGLTMNGINSTATL